MTVRAPRGRRQGWQKPYVPAGRNGKVIERDNVWFAEWTDENADHVRRLGPVAAIDHATAFALFQDVLKNNIGGDTQARYQGPPVVHVVQSEGAIWPDPTIPSDAASTIAREVRE